MDGDANPWTGDGHAASQELERFESTLRFSLSHLARVNPGLELSFRGFERGYLLLQALRFRTEVVQDGDELFLAQAAVPSRLVLVELQRDGETADKQDGRDDDLNPVPAGSGHAPFHAR